MQFSSCPLSLSEVQRLLTQAARRSTPGWKPIPTFPGFEIKEAGEVSSWWQKGFPGVLLDKPRVLPRLQHKYLCVNLFSFKPISDVPPWRVPKKARPQDSFVFSRETIPIRRLLLMAFVRLPEEGEVALCEGEERLENLKWGPPHLNLKYNTMRHDEETRRRVGVSAKRRR